jgi:hypothetical protein
LVQHLLKLQDLAAEAHAVVTQDENGNEISDCKQLLGSVIEPEMSVVTYKRK